mgnify:FL=1
MCMGNLFGNGGCTWILFIIVLLLLCNNDNNRCGENRGCGCGC